MATIFSSTIDPRTSNTPAAVAIVAPLNGLGVSLSSDQPLSVAVQVSYDAGATYTQTPQNIDLPLAGSVSRTVIAQGVDHIQFVLSNPGDILANVVFEGNPATF